MRSPVGIVKPRRRATGRESPEAHFFNVSWIADPHSFTAPASICFVRAVILSCSRRIAAVFCSVEGAPLSVAGRFLAETNATAPEGTKNKTNVHEKQLSPG